MEKLVLDAYPLVVYLKRQPGWEQVRDILKDAARGAEVLSLSLINWGEVIYSAIQDNGRDAGIIVEQVVERLPISIISPDKEMTRTAAEFKAMGGISYADCFAAALAVHENATLVTGDREFKRLEKKGLIKVLWI